MLIGELSNKTGFSKDTIRFYEKQGLISVTKNDRRSNNYKEYSDETLKRLLSIRQIKGFGFTLKETEGILDMMEMKTASCENVSLIAKEKIQVINKKIEDLNTIKATIANMISNCPCVTDLSLSENCPVFRQ